MRVALCALAAIFAISSSAYANPPSCNWGEETSGSILGAANWDQGGHASDPSGDGRGVANKEEDEDVPRVGLPNLFGQGDLVATCEFVAPD